MTEGAPHRNSLHAGLALRLATASIAVTLLVALVLGLIQLGVVKSQDREAAQSRFDDIRHSHLPELKNRLWEVNPQAIASSLESIASLSHVGRVSLVDDQGHRFEAGKTRGEILATERFPLIHSVGDRRFELGELQVELGDGEILLAARNRATQLAITVGLALLANLLILMLMLHRSIVYPLAKIAQQLATHEGRPELPVILRRSGRSPGRGDEVDQVVAAINHSKELVLQELARRRRSEAALQEYKENLEDIVDSRTLQLEHSKVQLEVAAEVAELGIWRLAVGETNASWNTRMFAIHQLPGGLSDQVGLSEWFAQMDPEDAARIANLLQTPGSHHAIIEERYRIVSDLAAPRHIKMRILVNRSDATTFIGVCQDVSAQINLESELRRAKDEADAMSAAKSHFLANMSHEIRTPMNGFFGMLALLKRDALTERQRYYLEMAESSASTLTSLINDILDFSKVEAGKLELDERDIDLIKLAHSCVAPHIIARPGTEVELIVDLAAVTHPFCRGDETRIRQILVNLLSNALKFTEKGYIEIALATRRFGSAVELTVTVSDTGIGIAEDALARLFQAFEQGSAAIHSEYGGTGLGLSICSQLCRLMGGEIQVESQEGEGSAFRACVQLAPSATPGAQYDLTAIDACAVVVMPESRGNRPLLGLLQRRFSRIETLSLDALLAAGSAGSIQVPHTLVVWADYAEQYPNQLLDLVERWSGTHLLIILGNVTSRGLGELLAMPNVSTVERPVTPYSLYPVLTSDGTGSPVSKLPTVETQALGLDGVKVLVVDDQQVNVEVARCLLQESGAEVTAVFDGESALHALREGLLPDVVLMDRHMPQMDGLACAKAIRSGQAGNSVAAVPIIAITAAVLQGDREQCLAAGMNDFLTKPVNPDELIEKVGQWSASISPSPQVRSIELTSTRAAEAPAARAEISGGWQADTLLAQIGGNELLLRKLLRLALDTLPQQVAELHSAAEAGDLTSVMSFAHRLKGTSAQLGASHLSALARDAEQSHSAEAYVQQLMPAIERAAADFLTGAASYLQEKDSTV